MIGISSMAQGGDHEANSQNTRPKWRRQQRGQKRGQVALPADRRRSSAALAGAVRLDLPGR